MLLVTDEDDCSHYGVLDGASQDDCYLRGDELPDADELLGSLQTALGRDDLSVHIIGGVDGGSCTAWYSQRLDELTGLADGALHDLSAPSLDTALTALAADLTSQVDTP